MRILRMIQVMGMCLSLGAFLMIGHQYFSAMTAPEGASARFVSNQGGEVTRKPQGTLGLMDSVKIFWAGLTAEEDKTSKGLNALHTRTRIAQLSEQERMMRDIEFWTGFTAKLGVSGP